MLRFTPFHVQPTPAHTSSIRPDKDTLKLPAPGELIFWTVRKYPDIPTRVPGMRHANLIALLTRHIQDNPAIILDPVWLLVDALHNLLKGAQTKAYEIAKNAADKAGVKIFNASVGGKLEIFPRVDFEGLFSD